MEESLAKNKNIIIESSKTQNKWRKLGKNHVILKNISSENLKIT